MYGSPRPFIPNDHQQWHYHRPPPNPQWRPSQMSPMYTIGPRGFLRARMPYHNKYRNTTPVTDNQDFWCETCDRGFPNQDLLSKHNQQHEKCNIEGCQFVAHPKVITKHIQMQHSTGLYKKIANLKNPEDIQKWREERKKKYPTKENIEKKVAAEKEKYERGEKIGLGKRRFNNNTNQGGDNSQRQNHGNHAKSKYKKFDNNLKTKDNYSKQSNNTSVEHKKPLQPRPPKVLPTIEETTKLKPFAGIQGLFDNDSDVDVSESNDLIDDDDFTHEIVTKKETKPYLCGALTSLMSNYESSDEDTAPLNNDGINEIKTRAKAETKICKTELMIQETKQPLKNTVNQESSSIYLKTNKEQDLDDGDSGPEEVKVVKKEEINEIIDETKHNKNKYVKNKKTELKKPILRKPKPKLPSTLLTKLLSREIQQERNIVLQCIRHIKNNNYFQQNNKNN